MTQQHTLKIGDVVRLKSASPPMVVELIEGETVHIVYIGYTTHAVVRDKFNIATLLLDPKTPSQRNSTPPWEK